MASHWMGRTQDTRARRIWTIFMVVWSFFLIGGASIVAESENVEIFCLGNCSRPGSVQSMFRNRLSECAKSRIWLVLMGDTVCVCWFYRPNEINRRSLTPHKVRSSHTQWSHPLLLWFSDVIPDDSTQRRVLRYAIRFALKWSETAKTMAEQQPEPNTK